MPENLTHGYKKKSKNSKKQFSLFKINPSQVLLINYKGITKPKKAALAFKFVKTHIKSGSQDQKERKTASNVTFFFRTKNHHSANSLLQLSPT